ncbi:MAG: hypothetical protein ABR567_01040 [Myxococcales bacterium]|nr:hypothetical protein [Myxococcales bacterium]
MNDKAPESLGFVVGEALGAGYLAGTPVPALLRRLTGDGLLNLFYARAEVEARVRNAGGAVPSAPALDDAVRPDEIPSVARGRREDRLLAEIDQDGFAFAEDPIDRPFFDRRAHRRRRPQNAVHVALVDGRVCVRKQFRPLRLGARRWGTRSVPPMEWVRRKLWTSAGLFLYNEAAALLRLHDLPFIPKLRRIDFADRAIYVDCVAGDSLRHLAASRGAPVHDHDLAGDTALAQLTGAELDRREVALLDAAGTGGDFRREIAAMTREINARGVAPLDIKLGNFIRGSATGRLHWIDFEVSRLSSQPRWDEDLALQNEILQGLFGL